jgi:urease accessory protein
LATVATVEAGISAGQGYLEFARVGAATVLTRSRVRSPLTILSPRRRAAWAWAVCGNLGGGLVAGDCIDLEISVREGASAILGTQSSTKVYRSPGDLICRQNLAARVEADAMLVLVPDPVTCFAEAVYEQRQRFDLHPTAGLVLVDWFTSGRRDHGERWKMTRCTLRTDIHVGAGQVLRDAIGLEARDGPLDSPGRMGRCDCFATVILVGRRVAEAAEELLRFVAGEPLQPDAALIFSAGSIPGGALLRVAGESTEQVRRWLGERLAFLTDMTGDDPFSRRG